jgi:hypothetical protein
MSFSSLTLEELAWLAAKKDDSYQAKSCFGHFLDFMSGAVGDVFFF